MGRKVRSAVAVAVVALTLVTPGRAEAATLSPGTGPILLCDSRPSTPTTLDVSVPTTGTVTDVNLKLNGLSHAFPDDIDAILIAPDGTATAPLSDAGGSTPINGVDITLDDEAAATIPSAGPITTGTSYKPSNYESPANDSYCPTQATSPNSAALDAFDGHPAAGTWRLAIVDDFGNGKSGSLTSFSLVITTTDGTITTSPVGPAQIDDQDGLAMPYPASFTVTGAERTISDLDVVVTGFTHSFPDDVDLLLVSPAGTSVEVLSDAMGGTDASGLDLTFDDEAAQVIPDESPATPGSYRPFDYEPVDNYPGPAPVPNPNVSVLSAFDGEDPNGIWTVYVRDDSVPDGGSIGDVKISFTTDAPSPVVPEVPWTWLLPASALAAIGTAVTLRSRRRFA